MYNHICFSYDRIDACLYMFVSEVRSGILFAIGTSVGASALPSLVAVMTGGRPQLTRAVWSISAFQVLKLLALATNTLLLRP